MNKKFLVRLMYNDYVCTKPEGYNPKYGSYLIDVTENNSIFVYNLQEFFNYNDTSLKKILVVDERTIENNCFEYDDRLETDNFELLVDLTGGCSLHIYEKLKEYVDKCKIDYKKIFVLTNSKYEFTLLDSVFSGENKPTYVFTPASAHSIGVYEILGSTRKKRFLFLSRNVNKNRFITFIDLMRRGVLDNTFYSFFHIKNLYRNWLHSPHIYCSLDEYDTMITQAYIKNTIWKNTLVDYWEHIKEDFYKSLPYTLHGEIEEQGTYMVGEQRISNSLHSAYNDSYMSLLVETYSGPDIHHFQATEKSFKAVYYRHPFLVYSNKDWLKRYKIEGYKTFSNVLDESYDDIEDVFERTFYLNEQVEYLNKIDINHFKKLMYKMNDSVSHNYQMVVDVICNPKKSVSATKNQQYILDTFIKPGYGYIC